MTARFVVLYETPANPERFEQHYREVHIPLARRLPGLRRYTVGRDLAATGGDCPYYMVAELDWDTMDELRAAFASPEGRACGADAAHLRELTPLHTMIFTVDDSVL
ncbi:MAG: EthD family reductase [Streptomyces sp.]|nr:EthD family reductase [Streptomyces sp.]